MALQQIYIPHGCIKLYPASVRGKFCKCGGGCSSPHRGICPWHGGERPYDKVGSINAEHGENVKAYDLAASQLLRSRTHIGAGKLLDLGGRMLKVVRNTLSAPYQTDNKY